MALHILLTVVGVDQTLRRFFLHPVTQVDGPLTRNRAFLILIFEGAFLANSKFKLICDFRLYLDIYKFFTFYKGHSTGLFRKSNKLRQKQRLHVFL